MASAGVGSGPHVCGELFKMMAGIEMAHVPYRGSAPALTDLIGGHVHAYFDGIPSSIDHIKAGTLRPLAVTTATRSEVLPDIPTMGEFLPSYEASLWFGAGAPRSTPVDVINTLNKAINTVLADPGFRARLADLGGTVLVGSPADFAEHIAQETTKWEKVVRFSGARVR